MDSNVRQLAPPARLPNQIRPFDFLVRLGANVTFLHMGNRRLLVADGGRCLFELPAWTDLIRDGLERGIESASMRDRLAAGLDLAHDETVVAACELLRSLTQHGLVHCEVDGSTGDEFVTELSLAEHNFRIACDDETIATSLRPLFAHVAVEIMRPDTRIDVRCHGDYVIIAPERGKSLLVRRAEAVPAIKGLVLAAVLADPRHLLALHAAAVVRDDRNILLVGSPGAGKTLFSLAALRHGFRYSADDVVFVDAAARVRGIPFAPAIKRSGWALGRAFADLDSCATHMRLDGVAVRYVPPPTDFVAAPLPIGATILLDRTNDGSASLDRIDPVDALVALLSEAVAPRGHIPDSDYRTFAAAVAAAPAYRLRYSDLDAGAASLDRCLRADVA